MATKPYWRCLSQTSDQALIPLRSPQTRLRLPSFPSKVVFTTSASYSSAHKRITTAKAGKTTPKRGEKQTFRKQSKKITEKGRPPDLGERKALRKRIVLSNTNAIEVKDMQDLRVESMVDMRLRGQVLGIPGPVVDQLRAAEAFKVSQGWGLFRRPGMLVRKETVNYGKLFEDLSEAGRDRTVRRVLVGEQGSGKSMMLLQAMTMAFLKGWIVINIPEAMDLTIAHTEYAPIPSTQPTLYSQKTYTAALLSRIAHSNPILSELILSRPHPSLSHPIQSNMSLSRLALLGAAEPEISHSIFLALLTELTAPSTSDNPRPPLLLTLDNLGRTMGLSDYLSSKSIPIHAHDLHLINWYTSHLSGSSQLPNGGLVLAATSCSNSLPSPSLDLALSILEARSSPTPREPLKRNPFATYDDRVLGCVNEGIEVQRLEGVSREEARGLMEYWAKSGMLRRKVSEGFVGEKWAVSGGGVVGELQRATVRMST